VNIKTTLKASVAAGALLALATPMQSAEAGSFKHANAEKLDITWGARIHRALRHVDDGDHDGIFNTGGSSGNSEVWVMGSGKLTEGITMGGLMRWDIEKNQHTVSFLSTTGDENAAGAGFASKYETIYFQHKLGRVTIGDWDEAAANTTNASYAAGMSGGGGGTHASSFLFTTGSVGAFSTRTVGAQFSDTDPTTTNVVRFDSMNISGFTVGASYSQTGSTSTRVQYSGGIGDISMVARLGYTNANAAGTTTTGGSETLGGSVALRHTPSGISAAIGMGEEDNHVADDNDPHYFRANLGYATKMNSLGTTTFTAHYHETEDNVTIGDQAEDITIGLQQALDSVGGRLGIEYSNISLSDAVGTDYNDIDVVYFETAINF
jgi:hypothetical protein